MFGEFCSRFCLPLLPQLVRKVLATWGPLLARPCTPAHFAHSIDGRRGSADTIWTDGRTDGRTNRRTSGKSCVGANTSTSIRAVVLITHSAAIARIRIQSDKSGTTGRSIRHNIPRCLSSLNGADSPPAHLIGERGCMTASKEREEA